MDNGQLDDAWRMARVYEVASRTVGRQDHWADAVFTYVSNIAVNAGPAPYIDSVVSYSPVRNYMRSGLPEKLPAEWVSYSDPLLTPFPLAHRLPQVSPARKRRALDCCRRAAALGSQPEAIGLYRLAIARDPGLAEAYLQLGALLYRRGDVEGALHTLLQEVNYHPPDQRAWHYLGYSYERRFDRKKNPADLRYAGMAYVLALICRPFRPELDMDVIRVRDKMVNI